MSDITSISAQVEKLNVNDSTATETAPEELVATVDELLNQLNSKFSNVSAELISKLDEMSTRLDDLEASIKASNAQTEGEGSV